MPLALFILIAIGGMVVIAVNNTSQVSQSYVLDAVSAQAFYAAESGAQAGMSALFLSDTVRQSVDTRCAAMAIAQTLNAEGLQNCSVSVSCVCRYETNAVCDAANASNYDGANGVIYSFYTVTSASQCGAGELISQHSVEVGSSL